MMGRLLKLTFVGALFVAPAACFANDLLYIYLQARDQDQQYQVAVHQRDAMIEAHPQAFSALLPQLTLTSQAATNRLHVLSSEQNGASSVNNIGTDNNGVPAIATSQTIDHYGTESYAINISQTLFDWGAFQTLAQSSREVAEAEANLRSAQQKLITRCAQAYFNLLNARDALRVDLSTRDAYNEQLVQGQTKYKSGVVAITDLRNAQASYDSANAMVITDRIALGAAVRALGLIVGRPVLGVADLRANIPLELPNPASPTYWSEAAARTNPDLLSSLFAAQVAEKQVSIARAKYLPTLNAVEGINRDVSNSVFGDDVITDSIGVNLSWTVYAGGVVASEVRQAQANFEQAQSQEELQRRTVDQSTRNDFQQVVDGIAAVKAYRLAVISNEASVEATKVGLKVGTRTESDVIVADESLSAALKAYYQSRYYYLNSVLALKQDSGLLTDKDFADIDRLFMSETTPALEPGQEQPLAGVVNSNVDQPETDALSKQNEGVSAFNQSFDAEMIPNELPPQPADAPPAENGEDLTRALSIVPLEEPAPGTIADTPAPPSAIVVRVGAGTGASCVASKVFWNVGDNKCIAFTSRVADGTAITLTANGKSGSASFVCRDGKFAEPKNFSCAPGDPVAAPEKTSASGAASCPAFSLHGLYANGKSEIDGRECYSKFPAEPVGVIEKLTCKSPGLSPRNNFSTCLAGGVQGPVQQK